MSTTFSQPTTKSTPTTPSTTYTFPAWHMITTVARREVYDTLRDWRLMMPIFGLTLFFPALMTFVADQMMIFLASYNSEIIASRSAPLLLMVVGFFPTSFSLVIALESFVGEKERKSLEPLLSTPLSDLQLYLGKTIAAVIPPLLASYIGIFIYTIGVSVILEPMRLASVVTIVTLTTVQALLMVAIAVVVSSQTTSVKAANMLASFIIVPISLLLQLEGYFLVYENYFPVWNIIVIVMITTFIFVRMGVQLFNREQLLGQELDYLHIGWATKLFWDQFTGRSADGRYPTVLAWYGRLWTYLPELKLPIIFLLGLWVVSLFGGGLLTYVFPLPPLLLAEVAKFDTPENLAAVEKMLNQIAPYIFMHNIRAIFITTLLGMMSFGVISALVFMAPWTIIGYGAAQIALVGYNPLVFLLVVVAPHGLFEFPAMLLTISAAVHWQITVIAPTHQQTITERWVRRAADFTRVFLGIGLPLFLVSAAVEGLITPEIIVWFYGG